MRDRRADTPQPPHLQPACRVATRSGRRRPAWLAVLTLLCCVGWAPSGPARANDAEGEFRLGNYEQAIAKADEAIRRREFGEDWHFWKARGELALGRYADAKATVGEGLGRFDWSLRLRMLAYEAALLNDEATQAEKWLNEIKDLYGRSAWRYADPKHLVAVGRAHLLTGQDPKTVLEQYYMKARKAEPQNLSPLAAIVDLALSKGDDELALATIRPSQKADTENPELWLMLGKAQWRADPLTAVASWQEATALNSRLSEAHLLLAGFSIRIGDFETAAKHLHDAERVDPHSPGLWAARAAVALLSGDDGAAKEHRDRALAPNRRNVAVDETIGDLLAARGRHGTAAAAYRRALELKGDDPRLKVSLGDALMWEGDFEEAERLWKSAQTADPYARTPRLRTAWAARRSQKTLVPFEYGTVRLPPEAKAVMLDDLTATASAAASAARSYFPNTDFSPCHVEVLGSLPELADGPALPGSGPPKIAYGSARVIVLNHPSDSLRRPIGGNEINWRGVLYRETFKTLLRQGTGERIPDWLAEGIAGYETRRLGDWIGPRLHPVLHARVSRGQTFPMGKLDAVLANPADAVELELAQWQTTEFAHSLATRPDARPPTLLAELARGASMEEAWAAAVGEGAPLTDTAYQQHLKERAAQFAPEADWEAHDLSAITANDDPAALTSWLNEHSHSVVGLRSVIARELQSNQLDFALLNLQLLASLTKDDPAPTAAALELAELARQMRQPETEEQALRQFAKVSDRVPSVLERLLTRALEQKDFSEAQIWLERVAAVNPFQEHVQLIRSRLAAERKDWPAAVTAGEALLTLKPSDPVEAHYRLAVALHALDDPRAKGEVLAALELAPRCRAAQELLLKLVDAPASPATSEKAPE